ncbi:MAG: FAD-dependent oxidoreductase [Planctomycetes bacterium]|nr:FAD-dependent oxidoreductase [Planctomycetota bacterium]
MKYDVVIIGAGPSGLAAAARLCHFGVKTCVLDSHSRLGGYNSWHHVRGREISTGLHAFTNYQPDGKGPLGRLLRQLRLKFSFLDLKPQRRSSIRFPQGTLEFSNDHDLIRDSLGTVFPQAVDGFTALRDRIRETDEGELTDRRESARTIVESYIPDPLVADMLMAPVMFYGNPGGVGDGLDPARLQPDMDWLIFCVVWKCIYETGFGHPAEGMHPLWEELARRIGEDGGVVRMSTRITALRTDGNRVVAAVTDSGEEIDADRFFSSAGGAETARLAGHEPPDGAIPVGSISITEGIGVLDRAPSQAGLEDTTIFFSHKERLAFRRPDELVASDSGVVCVPGNYEGIDDPTVKVTHLANYDAWPRLVAENDRAAKPDAAAAMAASLRRLGHDLAPLRDAPGRYGLFDDVFTPITLERFGGHLDGALYGSPVKSRSGATARENLFLIGTDQGFHGIVGAMLSGVAMANFHCLADRT